MLRRYRFALRPGWILLHLFTIALCVTMVLLGRWQLHVSEAKHFNLQNFGYSIQWWLFSAFALFFWTRILRDASRRHVAGAESADAAGEATHATPSQAVADEQSPVAYRRYAMPSAAQPSDDPVHAAYNDYLARLAAEDAEQR